MPYFCAMIGLRERAELIGGRLDHGPSDDRSSYLLRAHLPWPTPATGPQPDVRVETDA